MQTPYTSLFTYAEAATIVASQPDLAMRRVTEHGFGIWDTEADEWLISDLARKYLADAAAEMPPAD